MRVRIGPYRKNRALNVEIEDFDTWNLDNTLAIIIHPALIKLRDSKQGAPFVDLEDVPEELRPDDVEKYKEDINRNGTTDEKFFQRWDWVLDEMIWAFSTFLPEYEEPEFAYNTDEEKRIWHAHEDRIRNGTKLFGKYYGALWD